MTTDPARLRPPDPTLVEDKPEALRYWARTLETEEDRSAAPCARSARVLEKVKQELGIGGGSGRSAYNPPPSWSERYA